MTRRALLAALALACGIVPAHARQASPDAAARQDVRVRSWVSRTAVWVGDTMEFVVEFECPPHVGIIADDLAKDKLKLEGLEVIASSVERDAGIERFRYRLATYDASLPALRIASWPVRYYVRRAGERPEDVSPVGEVQVPGVVIARRSTLPDELPGLDLRHAAAPAGAPAILRLARPVGVGLILLAAAPLAIWIAALIGRRPRASRVSTRAARAQGRSALGEVRALDARSDASRREAYGRLDRAVRQHLADTRGIPAQALSAAEVAARLRAETPALADAAGELLAECERARYAPPDRVPPAERFTAAVDAAERMLAG